MAYAKSTPTNFRGTGVSKEEVEKVSRQMGVCVGTMVARIKKDGFEKASTTQRISQSTSARRNRHRTPWAKDSQQPHNHSK